MSSLDISWGLSKTPCFAQNSREICPGPGHGVPPGCRGSKDLLHSVLWGAGGGAGGGSRSGLHWVAPSSSGCQGAAPSPGFMIFVAVPSHGSAERELGWLSRQLVGQEVLQLQSFCVQTQKDWKTQGILCLLLGDSCFISLSQPCGWAGGKHCSEISIWDRNRSLPSLSVQPLLKKLCPQTLAVFLFNCVTCKSPSCAGLAWLIFVVCLSSYVSFS